MPLETVTLQMQQSIVGPDGMVDVHPRIENPLTIELRSAKEENATLRLSLASPEGDAFSKTHRYRFVAQQPNTLVNGRLIVRPGDQIAATLRVFDKDGRAWQFTWTPAESRSPVYTFDVLTQPPRFHAVEQTDPSVGSIAFGVRLIFSEPERFRLPELMPR